MFSILFLFSVFSDCLTGFSLLPGARRPHKGLRAGAKRSKPKQSVQRREQLLDRGTSSMGAIVHALPTERSRDMRTPEEIAALVPWVSGD